MINHDDLGFVLWLLADQGKIHDLFNSAFGNKNQLFNKYMFVPLSSPRDVSNNAIKHVDGAMFRDMTSLGSLRLDFNKLSELPQFTVTSNLKELSMWVVLTLLFFIDFCVHITYILVTTTRARWQFLTFYF